MFLISSGVLPTGRSRKTRSTSTSLEVDPLTPRGKGLLMFKRLNFQTDLQDARVFYASVYKIFVKEHETGITYSTYVNTQSEAQEMCGDTNVLTTLERTLAISTNNGIVYFLSNPELFVSSVRQSSGDRIFNSLSEEEKKSVVAYLKEIGVCK